MTVSISDYIFFSCNDNNARRHCGFNSNTFTADKSGDAQ